MHIYKGDIYYLINWIKEIIYVILDIINNSDLIR